MSSLPQPRGPVSEALFAGLRRPPHQLAGVSGQVSVQAFLFGNGLMNTLTPTSGMLLAYLATGKISFGRWIRFILPLAAGLFALCVVSLTLAVVIGL